MDHFLKEMMRESEKMRQDAESIQRHYEKLVGYVKQSTQANTIEWAKLILMYPGTHLLIVDTTPLIDEYGAVYSLQGEPIRLTAYNLRDQAIVIDQQVAPVFSKAIRGFEYHGLKDTWDMPRLADIIDQVTSILDGAPVVVFGLEFAQRALQMVSTRRRILDNGHCLHTRCRDYYWEFYYLGLDQVLQYQGINKRRSELTDSRERVKVLAEVLSNLAKGLPKQDPPAPKKDLADDEPF
jgi:hypothetical protein